MKPAHGKKPLPSIRPSVAPLTGDFAERESPHPCKKPCNTGLATLPQPVRRVWCGKRRRRTIKD